ncbi:MAG: hypothetical protein ACYC9N_18810 [Thermoanaerobaculia bacterium]
MKKSADRLRVIAVAASPTFESVNVVLLRGALSIASCSTSCGLRVTTI